jgi:hypothetical protein
MKKKTYTIIIRRIDYFYDILDDWDDCYDTIGTIYFKKGL